AILTAQLGRPDSPPRHLVLVRRPDPPTRRADLVVAPAHLRRPVQRLVIREEEMRTPAHPHPRIRVDPPRDQRIHLLEELERIDVPPVGQRAPAPRVQDPRRDLVQDDRLLTEMDRVTRVRAALVASDDIVLLRENVDDLPLSFVPPLGPYDHDA